MEEREGKRKWKGLKKDQIIMGILAGILLLVIVFPQSKSLETSKAVQQETDAKVDSGNETTTQMEQKFAQMLQQVEGVGQVRVMITIKSSGSKVIEKDLRTAQEERTTDSGEKNDSITKEETTVFIKDSQGNETPFVQEETAPVIEGVVVAAQGGDNMTVAENIADAAMVLFGVEAHKIKVMKLI